MSSKKYRNSNKPTTSLKTQDKLPVSTALVPIDSQKKPKTEEHAIEKVLNVFLVDIRAIQKTYSLVLTHVLTWLRDEHAKNIDILKSFDKEVGDDGKTIFKAEGVHQATKMLTTIREMQNLGGTRIPETLQRSLFTQIFSEFDAFIGALLKVIYTNKLDLLKGIAREITFTDLLNYDDLNAIKLDMLEKEIDSFRRDSYIEQFSTLEKKFKISTLKSFKEWGEFVELSQRRNILVHNGGRVSEQYLSICDKENYIFENRPEIGTLLMPSPTYFRRATLVISKVAFMLTHTLWRKLFSEDTQLAHSAANNTLYELLKDKRWNTGFEIAQFCMNDQMLKDISDIDLRIRTVNAAISAKFSENSNNANEYLNSIDWSASYRDFKLAIAVLTDKFEDAAAIMRKIGRNGELLSELDYHEWPLFHKFRQSPEFLNAYQEIYEKSFVKAVVKQSAEDAEKTTTVLEESQTFGK